MMKRSILGVAAATLAVALIVPPGCSSGAPLDTERLVGTWVAEPQFRDSSSRVVLAFEQGEEEALAALVSLPAIDGWSMPAGAAALADDGLSVTVGTWTLTYDPAAETLAGPLPEMMVPVHTIDAVFRRSAPVEREPLAELDAATASPLWTLETGSAIWAGLTFDNGQVFAANDAGNVHAVDAGGGRLLWQADLGVAVRARPCVDDGIVLVHADDGRLLALDRRDGSIRWTRTLRDEPYERGARYDHYASGVALDGDLLFVGSSDGRLHALQRKTGEPVWSHATGDTIAGTPAVGGGRVVVGSFDGKIHALAAGSGELEWTFDTRSPVPSAPAVAGDLVIVGSRSYDLFALDLATGEPAWTQYYWFSWVDSDALVDGTTAFVGSSDALRMNAFDTGSGRRLWSTVTGGWTWPRAAATSRAVFAGTVGVASYIGSRRGRLMAMDRETGEPLWVYPLPDAEEGTWGFAASPAVGAGKVFAADLDGRLYAFDAGG